MVEKIKIKTFLYAVYKHSNRQTLQKFVYGSSSFEVKMLLSPGIHYSVMQG